MKLLNDIPVENYDDTEIVYNFLNNNKTIGNEDAEYNGIWHLHWRGPIDNNKVILQLKSTLATQYVEKIYFWIEDENITKNSPFYENLIQFKDFVEIKVFNTDMIMQASGKSGVNKWVSFYYDQYHPDRRYKTDIFRHVILNIYGGIYTDADTLMLRDVRDIKVNNWSSSWGHWNISKAAEFCILKLEKGSKQYETLFLNDPQNQQCFLNIQNNLPKAFMADNLPLTPLPGPFFDIIWTKKENYDFLTFTEFEHFFQETDKEVYINNFFEGCFAYHWHNHWDKPELKESFAGKLNDDIDRIIKEKFGITPNKIFEE